LGLATRDMGKFPRTRARLRSFLDNCLAHEATWLSFPLSAYGFLETSGPTFRVNPFGVLHPCSSVFLCGFLSPIAALALDGRWFPAVKRNSLSAHRDRGGRHQICMRSWCRRFAAPTMNEPARRDMHWEQQVALRRSQHSRISRRFVQGSKISGIFRPCARLNG